MMRIVADENMPDLADFESLGPVRPVAGRELDRSRLRDADVLLVRSVTRVDAALLAGTPVRFVGSATIGTDHVDREWLERQGIAFRYAPGCNAMAVAEYVLQATLRWCLYQGRDPGGLVLGVVGCGNVGGRVAHLARALDMRVRICDPPRREAGEPLAPGEPCSLDEVLAADVVSLHVPLTGAGPWPTHHLLDRRRLERLGPEQLMINTSRGAVVDNQALRHRLAGDGPHTVLDVWEGEPAIDADLFRRCWYGTPHIAGYSLEGKRRGTAMLHAALLEWLGQAPRKPAVVAPEAEFCGPVGGVEDLVSLLASRYRLPEDHRRLADSLASARPAAGFDDLRRHYPLRHEMAGVRVTGQVDPRWRALLTALGVSG